MLNRLYLRDVGGEMTSDGQWVRPGLLYRSSAIHNLRREERQRLNALGLRHIIDLRELAVAKQWPDTFRVEAMTRLPLGMGIMETVRLREVLGRRVKIKHLAHRDLYADVLDANPNLVCGFLESLIDKPTPALVHCTAGKDRTGILVSVLYIALGVPRERIVELYLAIQPHLEKHFSRPVKQLVRALDGPPLAYSVMGEYMERMLDRIESKYGGAEGYLQAIQFRRLEMLRAKFLARPSGETPASKV